MRDRIEIEVSLMERRLNAIPMYGSERQEVMGAMRNSFILVEALAWVAHKIMQIAAALFSKPRLAS